MYIKFLQLVKSFYLQLQIAKRTGGYFSVVMFFINVCRYHLPAFLLAIFIICLRPIVKIKLVPILNKYVGHHALNTELYLKHAKKNNQNIKMLYYNAYPKVQTANQQLYKMWSRVIYVLPSLFNRVNGFLFKLIGEKYGDPFEFWKIFYNRDLLETSKTHLYFTKSELALGKSILMKMGIPSNAKFICLLVRDEVYHQGDKIYSELSAFRNSDIRSYKKSALFLANNGYYVLRMGKGVKQEFNVKHEKIIDYANSVFRSDFMDIYLSAHCNFFMSTLCGVDSIAAIFQRPILATNVTPLCYYGVSYPIKLFLAKKVVETNTGNILSFKEQLKIFNIACIKVFNKILNNQGLKLIENNEDEILDAVKEMLLLMQGTSFDTESEILQKNFLSHMPKELVDDTGKIIKLCQYKGRYSTADLLKNKALLEPEI